MIRLKHHGKIAENEWTMHFNFADQTDYVRFNEVMQWFDNTFPDQKKVFMGHRSDKTNLTVFFKDEAAYAFSLMKWS